MKLKCERHDRRVLSGKTSFLHRTGDMSPCDSKTAILRDNVSKTTRTFILNGLGGLLALATNKEPHPVSDGINLKRYTRPQE